MYSIVHMPVVDLMYLWVIAINNRSCSSLLLGLSLLQCIQLVVFVHLS